MNVTDPRDAYNLHRCTFHQIHVLVNYYILLIVIPNTFITWFSLSFTHRQYNDTNHVRLDLCNNFWSTFNATLYIDSLSPSLFHLWRHTECNCCTCALGYSGGKHHIMSCSIQFNSIQLLLLFHYHPVIVHFTIWLRFIHTPPVGWCYCNLSLLAAILTISMPSIF